MHRSRAGNGTGCSGRGDGAARGGRRAFGPSAVLKFLLCLSLAQSLPAPRAAGAGEAVNITGTVSDPSHAPLPRAAIRVHDDLGHTIATAQTDGRGRFNLALPWGRYKLEVTLAGFAPVMELPVDVTSSTPPLDIVMEIRKIEEWVVVTATRTEAAVSQVGNSVSVITGDELSHDGVVTMDQALSKVAGMTIVQNGGYGQLTSLFVRGGESDYTKVLLDGIPINDPGGSLNFANLSVADIDRIEIVRGPQSALYGSDAIAGTLQVFTRRGASERPWPMPRFAV